MFDLIYSDHLSDNSFISNVDARAKIVLFIFYISVVLLTDSNKIFSLVVLAIGLLTMIIVSRFPGEKIVKALIKIYPMIFLISIFQILSIQSGDYLHSGLGMIQISQNDWIQLFGFQMKTILIIASGLFMISSTPMKSFLKSFERFGMPGWILTVIFFIYHFVYILSHELTRLSMAYQSRYIHLSLFKRVVMQSKLMAMFFFRIFERNDRLYNALMSRGFHGSISFHTTLSWKYSDTILLLTGSTFLCIMLIAM